MGSKAFKKYQKAIRISYNEAAALAKSFLKWALEIGTDYDPKFKEDNEKLLLWKIEFEKVVTSKKSLDLAEFTKADIPFPGATRDQILKVKEFSKTLNSKSDTVETDKVVKMVLRIAVMELLRGHLEKYADDLNALPIPSSVPGSPTMPDWWGREEDQALLVGTYRLGYGQWHSLKSHPEYIYCTMNWNESQWPDGSILGDRLRKILAAMEKRAQVTAKLEAHKQIVMAPRKARTSRIEEEDTSSEEDEDTIASKRSTPARSSSRLAKKQKTLADEWTYKDRMEFVRLICLQGMPPPSIQPTRNRLRKMMKTKVLLWGT